MKPLRLYTAFHGNLDFSAMPDADRPTVIARCYWPLLSLPEELGIRIGFEMSARTLLALQEEDPEWVKRFRGLAERGLIEPIASGWGQIVAPLAPTEVNRANLALGNAAYQELLGFVPETFFVNEQTFSDGLVPLFAEAGARQIVMEWNNAAAMQPALRALRCQPARFSSGGSEGPGLLWNDSIVFQKVQRYVHGATPRSEVDALLDRLVAAPAAEALCIYGGDVEIFDYRPSRPLPALGNGESEVERLIGLLRGFAEDPRFEFALPREIIEEAEVLPGVRLGSAGDPIPCKKQPQYNPTRWAVSGRDGLGMNTRCHALLQAERAGRNLAQIQGEAQPTSSDHASKELVELWRSDFRTRTTEEKVTEFETGIALATEGARAFLDRVTPALEDGESLLLANPAARAWDRQPIEVPLRLPVGRFFGLDVGVRRGGELGPEHVQLEVEGRHRDGSIRQARLVLEPRIEARGVLRVSFSPSDPARSGAGLAAEDRAEDRDGDRFATPNVAARLLPHRGGALASLLFPEISQKPLIGTIAHGTFDEIAFTPDFYSGHVVAVSETGSKQTDLAGATPQLLAARSGAVRVTLEATVDTPLGPWRKEIRLYRHRPRIDLIHELAFHEARIASLRLGTVTLLPESWNRDALRYGTVNGGSTTEWHSLAEIDRIGQSSAVSPSVSATSCLGATEGWVAIEDDRHGLLVERDLAGAATAPMLDFARQEERFFCRLGHSAAETDETRATFLRGKRRFGFALEGYRAGRGDPLAEARLRGHGLVYRTEKGVGVTNRT